MSKGRAGVHTTISRIAATAILLLAAAGSTGCVFVSGNVNPFARRPQPLSEHVVAGEGSAKILLIDLSGTISNEEQPGPLGLQPHEGKVARLEAELQRAAEDDEIRGVIVRINSPGGTVTASDIAYTRLMRFKTEQQIPVVAQLMDVAASGGYYTALAADEIVAHPTTITGSIGVVFGGVSVEGLMEKLGVRNQTIKTGSKKDIGSPLRAMTDDERALLERLLGEMQARFVSLVRERRPGLTPEMDANLADGRVFSAQQALAGGLIDRIGYLEDTITAIKARAGVSDARIVLYRRPEESAETIQSPAAFAAPQINLINVDLAPVMRTPQFLYLWMP